MAWPSKTTKMFSVIFLLFAFSRRVTAEPRPITQNSEPLEDHSARCVCLSSQDPGCGSRRTQSPGLACASQ